MLENENTIQEFDCVNGQIPEQIIDTVKPLVLRGLVANWPLRMLGLESRQKVTHYLLQHYQGRPVNVAMGGPEIAGRVFYNEDFSGFNYQSVKMDLAAMLAKIEQCSQQPSPETVYMASTNVDQWLPGLRETNDISIPGVDPLVSIWMGNQTRIGAHYDMPDNIACSVVGRRQFTLFPPEQIVNLYPGPIDLAPGGQAISLVDFHNPDYKKHPNFRVAQDVALVVNLEPGDAIYIPSMWWHHVASFEDLNILVNYWWRQTPAYMGTPMHTIQHALLTLKSLPVEQRRAWREVFNYYIFDQTPETHAHIPEKGLGMLGEMDENLARQLRALMINQLNR
jgi:hypothetical protein